jgi:hypothetical protein
MILKELACGDHFNIKGEQTIYIKTNGVINEGDIWVITKDQGVLTSIKDTVDVVKAPHIIFYDDTYMNEIKPKKDIQNI